MEGTTLSEDKMTCIEDAGSSSTIIVVSAIVGAVLLIGAGKLSFM
jgi:hypothetical protein